MGKEGRTEEHERRPEMECYVLKKIREGKEKKEGEEEYERLAQKGDGRYVVREDGKV